ncbi:MAG TPA: SDR family oxidoreductase [Terriglobia bacterium]|jgi:nucleoside-diphosphate-sugar epimerase|nr:SDR family oxidoreductase [Terriglobia bacterium]
MPTYLVTGAAGFIGSNIVEELVRRGETVRTLDNLATGHMENLTPVRQKIQWHEADIRELESIRPDFEGVDYVIHLAAIPSVPRSVADPLTSNAVNIDGTLNVLLAARDAGVKRLVFAASSAAYGDHPALPRVETQELRPLSPYALTKLAGEYYCRIFTQVYGLETVALRYFNIFGPRQSPDSPYSGVLSLFISAYMQGKTPVIYGDGEQSRDFTYIENTVDATLRACTAPNAPGHVINVGTGERHTLNETIRILNGIFGAQITPRYDAPRAGDVQHSHADISLARRLLGYEPKVRFEEGLRKTVDWFRSLGS